MGRIAVSLLLRLLENQRVDALRIQLATKLVVRRLDRGAASHRLSSSARLRSCKGG